MKLTKEESKVIGDLLINTGFEIWNQECIYRLAADYADELFNVCEYSDSLHPIKQYKQIVSALTFLEKQDEN